MPIVLVTGAAGFIGSHISMALLQKRWNVVGIDSMNDFYDPEIKWRNACEIQELAESLYAAFQLYTGDLRDEKFLKGIFEKHAFDAVIHLAAYAGVRLSIENPKLYMDVNVIGTVNLLENMRNHGTRRLCFASSSSVYGNNTKVPFSESDPVDRAISPYAASKKAGEVLCHVYHHLHDINVACLRFFTVYGPRQRPDLAIHKFTRLMCEGKEIPFYGDGSMRRDHTYIDDIVDGVLRALEWTGAAEKRYDIFNLGESRTISLTDLVQTISKVINKEAIFKHLPMQPGDVHVTYADISHAREVLGYDPHTDFEEGMCRFWDWYQHVNDLKECVSSIEHRVDTMDIGKGFAI